METLISKPDVSVVIVSYNAINFLYLTLKSVNAACANLNVEIFVVDNNSDDSCVEMVKEFFPNVNVIANKENVGFSKANNQAIELAKGKYVLILNPDTIIGEDTLELLFSFMQKNKDISTSGIKMIDGSGEFLPESKRGLPSAWAAFCKMSGLSKFYPKSAFFNQYYLGHLPKDKSAKIDVLSGAFMFCRTETLKKVGAFDENYFMYGEDIDLSYNLGKCGLGNYYYANSAIIHFKGETTIKDKRYVKLFYKAMLQFANKYYNSFSYLFLKIFIRLGYYLAILKSKPVTQKKNEISFLNAKIVSSLSEDYYSDIAKLFKVNLVSSLTEIKKHELVIFDINLFPFKDIISFIEENSKNNHYGFYDKNYKLLIVANDKNSLGQIFKF